VKEGQVMIVDLFAAPIMAVGVVALLNLVARGCSKLLKRDLWPLRDFSVRIVTVVLLVFLATDTRDEPQPFKVWHIDDLREALLPHIEQPAVLLAKNRRLSQMLEWFLDVEVRAKEFGTTLTDGRVQRHGVQGALRMVGREYVQEMGHTNFYSCGTISMLNHWMDFEPVASLADLPVSLEEYGKRIEKDIYRIQPWSATNIVRRVSFQRGADRHVLMVNCYRIWDYPDRTYCSVVVGGHRLEGQLTNGMNFIEVDPSFLAPGGTTSVRVVSDGPLPAKPVFSSLPLGGELSMPLGAKPKASLDAYISDELRMLEAARTDACTLFDAGSVILPRFAPTGTQVVAEFRIKGCREEPSDRGEHFITLDAGHGRTTRRLPGRRGAMWAFVNLGPGTGHLEFSTVQLSTTFAPFRRQRVLKTKHRLLKSLVYAQLIEVRLRALSVGPGHSVVVDVGSSKDAPYLRKGFYSSERVSGNRTVRWTGGSARLGLPVPVPPGGVLLRVVCLSARPEEYRETPRFRVGGREIEPSLVATELGDNDTVTYSFRVSPQSGDAGELVLDLETTPWTPATDGGKDQRELGVMLDRIVVEPLPTGASS